MRKRAIDISVALALITAVLISLADFNTGCSNIKENVLRLHIIANSDSEYDQQLKLLVRDAVLEKGREIFSGNDSLNQAVESIAENTEILTDTAVSVLRANGNTDNVTVSLCRDNFTTRVYDGYTLPAGEYKTLKIVIGEGKGHNWWCVMFPPLCLPACTDDISADDVLNQKGLDVIQSSPKYEIRFKVVEWIENLKSKKKN